MKELGLWHGEECERPATAIISRDLLAATGARRHERVRVVARRRDMRETTQRRSSAETFSLLQEQGDMKELGLWHGEETARDHRNVAIISSSLFSVHNPKDFMSPCSCSGEKVSADHRRCMVSRHVSSPCHNPNSFMSPSPVARSMRRSRLMIAVAWSLACPSP